MMVVGEGIKPSLTQPSAGIGFIRPVVLSFTLPYHYSLVHYHSHYLLLAVH